MAKINPTEFSWNAPTTNTDGSAVTEALSYTLQVDGSDFLSFPGTLNADGKYHEDTANMALPAGSFSITLTAFYVDAPALVSNPSNAVTVIVGLVNPDAPLALAAA